MLVTEEKLKIAVFVDFDNIATSATASEEDGQD